THGEFKSIRVADKFRGKGAGEKIISHLITEAKKIGIKKLSVETGTGEFFLPARKLFQKFGFKKCEPFAHYKEDPNSCYYSLNI
ncbi:GNAT family N-acetyltransferase, partial [Candidatus Pelagibacter sp.]|nr:GNAT family N-acetyltransferase [Candidatus Pelagibacter sp.]